MTDVKLVAITDDRQKRVDAWRVREEAQIFINGVRALRAEAASLAMKEALANPMALIISKGQLTGEAATNAAQAARLEIFLKVWDELIAQPLETGSVTIV